MIYDLRTYTLVPGKQGEDGGLNPSPHSPLR